VDRQRRRRNAEADVLRDEGEAYAASLRAAGVPVTSVRYNGTIHDFVMLNALKDTAAARAATAQGGEFLRAILWDE
jgi:acetyl esterase